MTKQADTTRELITSKLTRLVERASAIPPASLEEIQHLRSEIHFLKGKRAAEILSIKFAIERASAHSNVRDRDLEFALSVVSNELEATIQRMRTVRQLTNKTGHASPFEESFYDGLRSVLGSGVPMDCDKALEKLVQLSNNSLSCELAILAGKKPALN